MSMDLAALSRLCAAGGAVLQKHARLLAAADASMHDSPAARSYAHFCAAWQADSARAAAIALVEEREIELVAAEAALTEVSA